MEGPVDVSKLPGIDKQLLGTAALAISYAVLTAREVAAVEDERLLIESESITTPQAEVVAALTPTTGLEPAVTVIGRVPVTEEIETPFVAVMTRPYPSTLMVGLV